MDWRFASDLLLSAAAFLGHFSIAVWLFNRLHSLAWPRKVIKVFDKGLLLTAALVALLFLVHWLLSGHALLVSPGRPWHWSDRAWLAYSVVCWAAVPLTLPCWLIPKLRERLPAALVANDTTSVDIAERLGHAPVAIASAKLLAKFPGNEVFRLAIQRKSLKLPRLPAALDGLSIAHLSDLHITGQLGREFYAVIVAETSALRPDIVVITGDILDKDKCLPWIVPIFSKLEARHGKYFILGNHETGLSDVPALRRALVEAGLEDLGGRCQRIMFSGTEILLAGDERPWFGAAPDVDCGMQSAECGIAKATPSLLRNPNSEFRILLAHTPDQLPWSKANGFDLMLAGHNHGGQIRLPYLGALISPSWYGFKYAGGLYHEPPTLLHVSRGISGIQQIRLNCPPELALLVLNSA